MKKKLWQWINRPGVFRRVLSWYGPYLGAGVKVTHIAEDFSRASVAMKLRWYNRNYVGVHFGGSLYSMVDPFYMLLLMQRLGRDFVVWDKAAEIEFIKPGKGRVTAHFEVSDDLINQIKAHTEGGEKYLPVLPVTVFDENNELVCRVNKTLYIRRKEKQSNLQTQAA